MARKKKERKPGRPKLIQDPATYGMLTMISDRKDLEGRGIRDTYYSQRAIGILQEAADIKNPKEEFDKFKAAFPAILWGTSFDRFKFKFSLLTELGRWEDECIPALAKAVEGMTVKEAITKLRAIRLDPEAHAQILNM
jgi:hypothetical protein